MNHTTETILYITGICLFLLIFTLGLIGYFIVQKQGNPFKRLLKEFDKKMWMTFGLGIFFFTLYLTIVYIASSIVESYNVFLYFYQYTSHAIYVGLSIFASITITIYLIRLVIKYCYSRLNFK